jgi:hypothetical protein
MHGLLVSLLDPRTHSLIVRVGAIDWSHAAVITVL